MSFRLNGIDFELSYPLIGLMTAVIIADTSMSVLVCLIAVIMHEAGHLVAMKCFGCAPDKIRLTLFDIAISDKSSHLRSDMASLVISLAGPAVNLISAAVLYSFCLASVYVFRCDIPPAAYGVMTAFADSHLALGLFNLLPVDTLDGGQAIMILLMKKTDIRTALKITEIVSLVILIPSAVLGFIVLIRSKYNFTLLLTSLYLIFTVVSRH